MLLAIQILLGVLFAGTGIGLVVDISKSRMDELKGSTGKQWASAFAAWEKEGFPHKPRFWSPSSDWRPHGEERKALPHPPPSGAAPGRDAQ